MFYLSDWFSVAAVSHVSLVRLVFVTGVSHVLPVRLVFSYRSVTCFTCQAVFCYKSVTCFTCQTGFQLLECHMFHLSRWFLVTGVPHVLPVRLVFC